MTKKSFALVGILALSATLVGCGDTGDEPLTVPDVSGLAGDEARDLIAAAGLQPSLESTESSVWQPGNWEAESTEPEAGTEVEEDDEVIVHVIRPVTEQGEEYDGETEANSESSRPFEMDYEIRTDPDRTLQVKLSGSFEVNEEKAEAAAGKTEIFMQTTGKAEVTNVSDGRSTEEFNHGFQLFLPVDDCPNWGTQTDAGLGDYCTYDMFTIEVGDLEAGESQTIDLDVWKRIDEVQVDDADDVLASIMGPDGVMVSAARLFWNLQLEELNPACPLPGDDTQWVTYVSESEEVNACSTETDSS